MVSDCCQAFHLGYGFWSFVKLFFEIAWKRPVPHWLENAGSPQSPEFLYGPTLGGIKLNAYAKSRARCFNRENCAFTARISFPDVWTSGVSPVLDVYNMK